MLRSVFASALLPPHDRFDAWCELVSGSLLPVHNRSEEAKAFTASVETADLGGPVLSLLRFPSVVCHRTPALVRRSDAEQVFLALSVQGSHGMEWEGRQFELGCGDLVLYDSSHAFSAVSRQAVIAVVGMERRLLPLRLDPLLGRPLSGGSGTRLLLRGLLGQLVRGEGGHRPEDAGRLGGLLLDLVALTAEQELGQVRTAEPERRDELLRSRVRAFVQARLADQELTPAQVAAAHHISVRYLHRLFEQEPLTVAAYIRSLRLERARRLLADRASAGLSLQAVAVRCGFRQAGDLGRAFRAAYGVSPGAFRRISAGVEGGADAARG